MPQVLGAAERRGAVLGAQPEDLLAPLRVDADDRRRTAVRPDHQVAHSQVADRAKPVGVSTGLDTGCARPRMNASGATSMIPRSK